MAPDAAQLLVRHYTSCFQRHGATPQGVNWPNAKDIDTCYRVMMEAIRPEDRVRCELLDLGCGYGALKDYMNAKGLKYKYHGIDLSDPMLDEARRRHPGVTFERRDVVAAPLPNACVDYVIMNGVFTEKRELSFDAMEQFMHAMLAAAFLSSRKGIAFNVMSVHVEWQRDDLFHLPLDRLFAFLKLRLSRHIVFRLDYGLWSTRPMCTD